MLSQKQQRELLLDLLQENGGRLGNLNARRLLSDKLKADLSIEDYDQIKEGLISQGIIKKAQGRGGSIELLPQVQGKDSSEDQSVKAPAINSDEKTDILFTALSAVPGLRAKRNKSTITVLCGEDHDKLYCGWNASRSTYFVSYRWETGKEDRSDVADSIFKRASSDIPYASIERYINTTTLYLCDSVAQVNRVMRRLKVYLDDTSLDNGPIRMDPPGKPRSDSYFFEIATLIKFCVDNNLSWPLKNWRKTLGFDDVDELIVIGRSLTFYESPYREHVVPVSLIRDEARNLAERGAPVRVIAEFIRCHLYVVLISEKEADILNRSLDSGGMSLKDSMPEGWVFGHDPLERIISAGITVNVDRLTNPIPKWKPWKGPGLRDKIRGVLNTPLIKV